MGDVVTPVAATFTLLGMPPVSDGFEVPTRVYISVLERIGITARTTRVSLDGMVNRGYLDRQKRGREAIFVMTDDARVIVSRNRRNTFGDVHVKVNASDSWTLLSYSIPETQRSHRHRLRSQLLWQGFGALRDGLWIAYGDHDISAIVDDADIADYVTAFSARPTHGDPSELVERTWNLDMLRERFDAFLSNWETEQPSRDDDALAKDILLVTEWRHLLRDTPQLPAEFLPDDWPASDCQDLFRRRHAAWEARAHADLLAIIGE
jgi:phenylacetic acid degradation operon negative regulatory protein